MLRFTVLLLLLVPATTHAQARGTGLTLPLPAHVAQDARLPYAGNEHQRAVRSSSVSPFALPPLAAGPLANFQLDEIANPANRSVAVPVIIGAVAGAAIGTAVLFAPGNCRSGESMCGVGIPLYVGGGVLVGGLAGYLFAISRG